MGRGGLGRRARPLGPEEEGVWAWVGLGVVVVAARIVASSEADRCMAVLRAREQRCRGWG